MMDMELTTEQLLQQWTSIIQTSRCSNELKAKAIREAYDIGVIAGQLQGARKMGDEMMAAMRKPDAKPA
jgi:hypothetical protein